MHRHLPLQLSLLLLFWSTHIHADRMDEYRIGDHGTASLTYPSWFKKSFFDLRDDLNDADAAGKRGVIVFFSQRNCQHCQAFIDITLHDPTIGPRVQDAYDIVPLDIFSDVEVTYLDGSVRSIRDFAEVARARLTPTLLFLGVENKPLLKIVGFYPPEKFGHALDYVEGKHYQQVTLSEYLRTHALASTAHSRGLAFDYDLFARPPHVLRPEAKGHERMTLVVFERPDCNPCRRFHQRVLADASVRGLISGYRALQLDTTDDVSKVVVGDGRTLTPKEWSEELQLNYDIAVVFFDERGNEVHRLDSEVGKDRMVGSLQFVQEKAYEQHEQFLRWRKEQALEEAVPEHSER